MTQQHADDVDSIPSNEVAPEPLPHEEEFWRPPARFGSVPVDAEPLG